MKKKLILTLMASLLTIAATAQVSRRNFHAYLYNNEYKVYLRVNLYEQNIQVPGQELYGELPGYLGKQQSSFCWVITSCQITGEREATLQLINDFGSEDLRATLTCLNDSTYTLRQVEGSPIKVPNNGKWQKLPKTLELRRKIGVSGN